MSWRAWFDNDSIYTSRDSKSADLPGDGLLVRMLYYEGGGKQIQQGVDFYYEAPHSSGESILGCGMDKDEIEERYPGAIIIRGRWAPDEYYKRIVAEAMASVW